MCLRGLHGAVPPTRFALTGQQEDHVPEKETWLKTCTQPLLEAVSNPGKDTVCEGGYCTD